MNIFDKKDYRIILRCLAQEQHLSLRQLATAARIHTSYFSRVMNGGTNVSPDQMFRLATQLHVDAEERDYLLLLLEAEAAGDAGYRAVVEAKVQAVRTEKRRMETLLHNKSAPAVVTEADLADYYRNIITAKVHMYLTIPTYREQPARIAERLAISQSKLATELHRLERLGVIKRTGEQVTRVKAFVHLDSRHTVSVQNHINWRLDAASRLSKRDGDDDDYAFSVVFSANREAMRTVREAFKAFVVQAELIVRETKEEEVYQMTFDLLRT